MLVRRLKQSLALLSLIIGLSISAHAQGIRFNSVVQQQATVAGVTNVVTIPAAPIIAFCNAPANGAPCTNKATTYTDATLVTPCSTSTQIVLDGTSSCVANTNAQGNWGVWIAPNTAGYTYTVTVGGATLGPFFVLPQSSISTGNVTNAQLPNPMNLTDTLSINVTSGLGLHITNSSTSQFVTYSNSAFPTSGLGFSFQSPGFPTLLGNSGLGNSQFVITSKDFKFLPFTGLTGGIFSIGPLGSEYEIGTDTAKLIRYANAAAVGNGQGVIRASIDQTIEVTGNSGTLTLYTPVTNSDVYRLVIYTVVSTGVATSTIQWTASYTDVTGARTTVGTSIAGDTTGTHLGEEFRIESQSGVAITLATATANSPKYKYYVRLEEL